MFTKVKSPVCPGCQDAEDVDQEKVREVLAKDDKLNTEEVARLADVDIAVVRRMVDDGLVVQSTGGERPVCGRCGSPAISMAKKLCQGCLEKLNQEVSRAQASVHLDRRKAPQIGEYNMSARKAFEEKRK